MEEATLVAEQREVGKSAARQARREGKVPAIVYGLGTDPEPVKVPGLGLQHILAGAGGANTLINLDHHGEKKELVLARQVVRHPVRHTLVHLDFVRVSRDIAVSAEVPLHLVGESPGVRDGGIIEQSIFTLSIEAKPGDLPAGIEVDVSGLEMGDQILVSDLNLPAGVVTTQDAGELVLHVVQPRGMALPEEIEAAEAEAAEAAEAEAAEGGGDEEG